MYKWNEYSIHSTVDEITFDFFEWAVEVSDDNKSSWRFLSDAFEAWVLIGPGSRECSRNFECFQAVVITSTNVWLMAKLGLNEDTPVAMMETMIPARVQLLLNPDKGHHNILDRYWFNYHARG